MKPKSKLHRALARPAILACLLPLFLTEGAQAMPKYFCIDYFSGNTLCASCVFFLDDGTVCGTTQCANGYSYYHCSPPSTLKRGHLDGQWLDGLIPGHGGGRLFNRPIRGAPDAQRPRR